jgi:hypothetical protein
VREGVLKGHEEPIDITIVELSFRSAALEERGRQCMAEERRAWYEMEDKQATDEVAELEANEEVARQHVSLSAALEAEVVARTQVTCAAMQATTERL